MTIKKIQIIFDWLLLILWGVVICYLSSIPSLKSDLPSNWDFYFRKMAHMVEFAVLFLLLFKVLRYYGKLSLSLVFTFLFAIIFAILDEYHQSFVFGRHGSFGDVLIDSCGIILASVFVYFKYFKKIKC